MPTLSIAEKEAEEIPLTQLLQSMGQAKRRIQGIIKKAIESGSTSREYYEARLREIDRIYKQLTEIQKAYLDKNIPGQFRKASRLTKDFLESLGLSESIKPLFALPALQAIIQNTMLYVNAAVENGKKEVAQLFVLTQQSAISELAVNQAITEGVIAQNTVQAAAKSLEKKLTDKLLKNGRILTTNRITGKTRSFTPEYYAEMTARTRAREAQSLGTINTVLEFGQDLVKVSDHNTLTPECKIHEGKIYSITGKTPGYEKYEGENVVPYHPNCLHVITPHIPRRATQPIQTALPAKEEIKPVPVTEVNNVLPKSYPTSLTIKQFKQEIKNLSFSSIKISPKIQSEDLAKINKALQEENDLKPFNINNLNISEVLKREGGNFSYFLNKEAKRIVKSQTTLNLYPFTVLTAPKDIAIGRKVKSVAVLPDIDTLETVISHEIGHYRHYQETLDNIDSGFLPSGLSTFDDLLKGLPDEGKSKYALTNQEEFVAETYAYWRKFGTNQLTQKELKVLIKLGVDKDEEIARRLTE